MIAALQTSRVTKRYGRTTVVDALCITVPRRSIYGFLGANGAGKTTTIKMVLGLIRPDAGTIRLFGERPRGRTRHVGALVETPALYDHLTGTQNLDLTRRLLGLPASDIARVLAIVDLQAAANRLAGGYSLGMRQRLGIARALLGSPQLLLLDEPTNGLDPEGIREMRELLRRLPQNGDVTLIVSSHLLGEIEQVATHVGLIHRGRLLAEAAIADLVGAAATVEVKTGDRARSAVLLTDAGFRVAEDSGNRLMVARRDGLRTDPSEIARLLVAGGQSLAHLAQHHRSLEHVYHDAVRSAAA